MQIVHQHFKFFRRFRICLPFTFTFPRLKISRRNTFLLLLVLFEALEVYLREGRLPPSDTTSHVEMGRYFCWTLWFFFVSTRFVFYSGIAIKKWLEIGKSLSAERILFFPNLKSRIPILFSSYAWRFSRQVTF